MEVSRLELCLRAIALARCVDLSHVVPRCCNIWVVLAQGGHPDAKRPLKSEASLVTVTPCGGTDHEGSTGLRHGGGLSTTQI